MFIATGHNDRQRRSEGRNKLASTGSVDSAPPNGAISRSTGSYKHVTPPG